MNLRRSVRVYEELPLTIQEELKKSPFTWEGRKWHRVPKEPDGTYSPVTYRAIIKSSLCLGNPVLEDHIKFVREYPEHVRWLRDHLDESLWLKLKPYCTLPSEIDGN